MTVTLETNTRDVLADALDGEIGAAGTLVFEEADDSEVATITFDNPAFGSSSSGTITMAGAPKQDTDAAGGTIEHASIYKSGPTKVLELSCGTSGEEINLSSLSVTATDTVELTSLTITMPAS